MKKIFNIFLVKRIEIKDKWWHRLFTVLVIGSAIVLFIFSFFLMLDYSDNHTWITPYRPVAFSLEQNYKEVSAKESNCVIDYFMFNISKNEPVRNGAGIKCEGVILSNFDSKKYAELYFLAREELEKQYGFDKYFDKTPCLNSSDKFCEMDIIAEGVRAEQKDPFYNQFQNDEENLAKIKIARDVNFGVILKDIALWLIITIPVLILWVIFWYSIIYRVILYIIYGKQK